MECSIDVNGKILSCKKHIFVYVARTLCLCGKNIMSTWNSKKIFSCNQAHMLILHMVTTLENNTFQCMHFKVTSTTKKRWLMQNLNQWPTNSWSFKWTKTWLKFLWEVLYFSMYMLWRFPWKSHVNLKYRFSYLLHLNNILCKV